VHIDSHVGLTIMYYVLIYAQVRLLVEPSRLLSRLLRSWGRVG
jgi:hypothetical protein